MPTSTTGRVVHAGRAEPVATIGPVAPRVVAPGCRLRWNVLEPTEVVRLAKEMIVKSRSVLDNVVAAADAGKTAWADIMQPLADDETETRAESAALEFLQHVSPHKALRDASTEADKLISEFGVECEMRVELYRAVQAFAETAEGQGLSGERARFLSRILRDFKRNGLHLEEETRAKVKAMKEEMSKLSIEFAKNCNDESTKFELSPEALDGVPASDLSRIKKLPSGDHEVSLDYFPYFTIMDNCKVEATRQKLEKAFNSKCKDVNTDILTRLCQLRQQKAKLLGYSDHATFVLEVRMAKSPTAVQPFLRELSAKLEPLRDAELKVMLEYKAEEMAAAGGSSDGKINLWDFRYYDNMVKEKKYQVDQTALSEYFPLDVVTDGLLEIYQELLGLRFTRVANAETWHPEVMMFEVRNAADDAMVGYFYLDMHPREGKYGHAACWGLQPACTLPGGARQLPISACVCNFTKPTEELPSLLKHGEVETFFHEFGHCMHGLCSSEPTFSRFAGTAVERDFVEAPSQMLENWCWDAGALARMSKHYKSGEPIPPALVEKIIASKNANAGFFNKRQLVFGLFDQRIHGIPDPAWEDGKPPLAEEMAKLQDEVWGIPATPGTCMPASFGHLAGGYDAQYYGYMWSEVFSADMFERILNDPDGGGVFSKDGGAAYRRCILAPGGSKDAEEMLREFLGREPTQEAFLRSKGL